MKQITFDQKHLMPKLFMSVLMLLSLSVFSMFAVAAQETAQSSRDFNHMTTGFPLTGLHLTAECSSCHVGGVFKGTPRNCSGCHAKGKRVVATAMSAQHLVTTEPCEVCHTNTVTFYGAKYNHGKAVVGQCATCHNGHIATGRAASHATGKKATASCDSCHRTYAWTPASWNHTVGGACSSCHDGVTARGKSSGHVATTDECSGCHTSQLTWLGALGGKPANHIPYIASAACSSCHTGGTVTTGNALHAYVSSVCKECHNSSPVYLGKMQRKTLGNHKGSNTSQDCTSCHRAQYTQWDNP